ncbi:MAG: chorismate synthase [Pseudobutyrivibrio sp.]|uniref:chorismate synthase n=1 Tax=Pseudobutyrivibrio sp. TaxID=2014367 RepID=UPI001B16EE26|nr:chorismate synthase [Pseudobutyrivibrio sp.]MBO5617431.1 chorismate synthase [Pseudobutyrivibrio sp.]MBO6283169.1 chorismate synthase [Pseudobutyrivibrio sp.]MBP3262078.1 chorismate synthase [Pseudobutyrivibrio sp.]
MAGSTFGSNITVTTWGESHGKAIGAVIDGIPAGMKLDEHDIQIYLDRRKPGQSKFTTARNEADQVKILSGVFEGVTTGTPISIMVENTDQHSKDYGNIATCFRPGHADYGYIEKYGLRDYRGGGRSSGRETIGRVAAGAICAKLLSELGITVCAYTKSIGDIKIYDFDLSERDNNALCMPDPTAAKKASEYLEACMLNNDSAGGIIECLITGVPAGVGDPVFDKLDANLSKALVSIGSVKGVEIGDGFAASKTVGSINNDKFRMVDGKVTKATNHSGGILGGISDGDDIIVRCAIKPTPSISQSQPTVNEAYENLDIEIHGRHDPVIVPRAVVVVEAMCAITICDALFSHMTDRLDYIKEFYKN